MFILRKDKATQLQSPLQTLETRKHAPWAALLPTLPVAQAAGAGDATAPYRVRLGVTACDCLGTCPGK